MEPSFNSSWGKKNLVILDKQPSGDIIKSVAGRRAKMGGRRWNARICASTLMCVCADPLFADIFLFRRSDQSQKKQTTDVNKLLFLCLQQRGESVFDKIKKCFMAMPRFTSACVFQVSKLCLFQCETQCNPSRWSAENILRAYLFALHITPTGSSAGRLILAVSVCRWPVNEHAVSHPVRHNLPPPAGVLSSACRFVLVPRRTTRW